jgi:hypothetical protein
MMQKMKYMIMSYFILSSCEKIELLDRTNDFDGAPNNGSIPIVNTISANNISNNSASLKGEIIFDGDTITQHGHCWSLNNNPSLNVGWCTFLESPELSIFYSFASNLTASTNYYYIAYATNTHGTSYYGEVKVFQTSSSSSEDILGCTDPNATNYNSQATLDDGSCQYSSNDCQDGWVADCDSICAPLTWLGDGSCDDGIGTFYNFNCDLYGFDNGDCLSGGEEDIAGCIDPLANNYNPLATIDDGSCCTRIFIYVSTGYYNEEISWNITDQVGDIVHSGGAPYAGVPVDCIPYGCYDFNMSDSYGDGWNGSTATISAANQANNGYLFLDEVTLTDGSEASITFGIGVDCPSLINTLSE